MMIVAIFIARLLDPVSLIAALLVAVVAQRLAGSARIAVIIIAALAIATGINLLLCSMHLTCRDPFDDYGLITWLIGSVASGFHLLIAFGIVDWLQRRRAKRA